jgi:serine/threonine protein kinase
MSSGDLIEILKCESILEENKIKLIIKQIANGLNYLHEYGIIHRDLKPQNILIKEYPPNIVLKIGDFGLSKVMGMNETTSDCLGTIYFSSPEIIMKKRYSNKVDVWSLGVIIYILLFGVVPFNDNKIVQTDIGKRICTEEIIFPNIRQLSNDLISLIKGCLDKNYQKRFSIKDVLNHKWFI